LPPSHQVLRLNEGCKTELRPSLKEAVEKKQTESEDIEGGRDVDEEEAKRTSGRREEEEVKYVEDLKLTALSRIGRRVQADAQSHSRFSNEIPSTAQFA
jgi:hypothetical protein